MNCYRVLAYAAAMLAPLGFRGLARAEDIAVYDPGVGWLANGKSLQKGQTLAAGTSVQTQRTGSHGLILKCSGGELVAYVCGQSSCETRVCAAPANGVQITKLDAGWKGSLTKPAKNPTESYIMREAAASLTLGVKGGGFLADAVLTRKGENLLWGPMLQEVLEGKYCFRVAPLPPAGHDAAHSFLLDWDRSVDATGAGAAPGLKPGLYRVEMGKRDANDNCKIDEEAGAAWVLIPPENGSDQIQNAWKQATDEISQLEAGGASPRVAGTFRRAVISYLADSSGR